MAENFLLFREVKQRFQLIGIKYCAPYKDGTGYFVGYDRAKAAFPYATGPICHVRKKDDDLVPYRVVMNWMHQLAVDQKDIDSFWAIQSYPPTPPSPPSGSLTG